LLADLRRAGGEIDGVEPLGGGGEPRKQLTRGLLGHLGLHLVALLCVRGKNGHASSPSVGLNSPT